MDNNEALSLELSNLRSQTQSVHPNRQLNTQEVISTRNLELELNRAIKEVEELKHQVLQLESEATAQNSNSSMTVIGNPTDAPNNTNSINHIVHIHSPEYGNVTLNRYVHKHFSWDKLKDMALERYGISTSRSSEFELFDVSCRLRSGNEEMKGQLRSEHTFTLLPTGTIRPATLVQMQLSSIPATYTPMTQSVDITTSQTHNTVDRDLSLSHGLNTRYLPFATTRIGQISNGRESSNVFLSLLWDYINSRSTDRTSHPLTVLHDSQTNSSSSQRTSDCLTPREDERQDERQIARSTREEYDELLSHSRQDRRCEPSRERQHYNDRHNTHRNSINSSHRISNVSTNLREYYLSNRVSNSYTERERISSRNRRSVHINRKNN